MAINEMRAVDLEELWGMDFGDDAYIVPVYVQKIIEYIFGVKL